MDTIQPSPDITWPPPTHLPPTTPVVTSDGIARYDGLTYAATPGYRPRLLDLLVPPSTQPVPVVVWIHGGGWLTGDRRYPPPTVSADLLFGSVLAADMAMATIDYRLSLEAPFPAQLHDVKAAIRYLRHHAEVLGVDGARMGLWGESAGGHLAALAALAASPDPMLEGSEGVAEGNSTVQAVVDWYGVSDIGPLLDWKPPGVFASDMPFDNPFTSLLGGTAEEHPVRARAASPVTYAGPTDTSFLLVHGTHDSLVPYDQSELLADRLRAHGVDVTLKPVPDADHIFLGAPDVEPIVADSVTFLAEHLHTGRTRP